MPPAHRKRVVKEGSGGDNLDDSADVPGVGAARIGRKQCRQSKERTMANNCQHLDQIRDVTPSADGCEECLATGDRWVHLRLCLECGHVGCCDSSKNKHATKHYQATQHPIIQSFEPGENWRWCYVDEKMV
jgi:uncharacterized UBP type Zn finger protein